MTASPPDVLIDPVQVAQRLATRIAHLELENAELHATIAALRASPSTPQDATTEKP